MYIVADKHLWESFNHIIGKDGEGGETERKSGEGGEAVGAAHLVQSVRQLERRETNSTGDEDRGCSNGRIDIRMGKGGREADTEEDR